MYNGKYQFLHILMFLKQYKFISKIKLRCNYLLFFALYTQIEPFLIQVIGEKAVKKNKRGNIPKFCYIGA